MIDHILAIQDPETRTRFLRAHYAMTVTEQVKACKACDLRSDCSPVAMSGSSQALLSVVAPWPSAYDQQTGQALSGRERETLELEIANQVGLAWHNVAIMHAVCCKPRGIPRPGHWLACMGNLAAQLAAAGSPVILALGEEVAAALLPSGPALKIGQGYREEATGRVFFCTHHPLMAATNPEIRKEFQDHLWIVGGLVHERCVWRALEIFAVDSTWPTLIEANLRGLSPENQEAHRWRFWAHTMGRTSCDPRAVAAVEAVQQVFVLEGVHHEANV